MKLHNYQQRAIDFILKNKTVFLAIDMGLGKTIISLEAVRRLKMPAMVIGPLNPIYETWPTEIEKWNLPLEWAILHGPNKDYILKYKQDADILLLNYQGIKWFATALSRIKKWRKRILILDESSMIKNPSTQRFKILKQSFPLWLDYKICLSATPAPNGYHELWSQYYMLDRGQRLGKSYYSFRGTYFIYTGPPQYKTYLKGSQAKKTIIEKIKPITFRLKDSDYLKLPDCIYNKIALTLPKKLHEKYEELEKTFILQLSQEESVTVFSAAALSMKLRQFIQGAVYINEQKDYEVIHKVKLEALKEFLELNSGKSILCPIQFKFEKELINKTLGYTVPCIAGQTSRALASKYIKEWNAGKIPLLLCHPASLGHGVNLQSGGHTILWFGLTWSLEHYKQLNGRIYRQGQRNTVVIHHLLLRKTIDTRLFSVLSNKEATQEDLLDALRRPL